MPLPIADGILAAGIPPYQFDQAECCCFFSAILTFLGILSSKTTCTIHIMLLGMIMDDMDILYNI
jgi:hypothetical protein